jgi:hypothetical protein
MDRKPYHTAIETFGFISFNCFAANIHASCSQTKILDGLLQFPVCLQTFVENALVPCHFSIVINGYLDNACKSSGSHSNPVGPYVSGRPEWNDTGIVSHECFGKRHVVHVLCCCGGGGGLCMVPTRIDAAAAVSSVNNHTNIIRIAKKSTTTTTEVLKQQ